MHVSCDADAHGCTYATGGTNGCSQPQRTIGAEINSVQPLIDVQCSGQPSRALCQIREFVGVAMALHQVDAFERLDGAQEDAGTDARFFGRDVEHVGRAINEIYIGKSPAQK